MKKTIDSFASFLESSSYAFNSLKYLIFCQVLIISCYFPLWNTIYVNSFMSSDSKWSWIFCSLTMSGFLQISSERMRPFLKSSLLNSYPSTTTVSFWRLLRANFLQLFKKISNGFFCLFYSNSSANDGIWMHPCGSAIIFGTISY